MAKVAEVKLGVFDEPYIHMHEGLDLGTELYTIKRLTEKEVEDILVKCVNPIDKGLHWDFKKLYEDLFEAITGEKHGNQE